MLTANLLPAEEKKKIRVAEYRRMARFLGLFAAASLVVGIILLIPSYVFLSIAKKNLQAEDAAETAAAEKLKLEEAKTEAARAQTLLADAKAVMRRPPAASRLFKIFFADAAGVRVKTLSIDAEGNLLISGFAETRDDLLNFQKKLNDTGMLERVTFPISDIIRSADIAFTMQGKFEKDKDYDTYTDDKILCNARAGNTRRLRRGIRVPLDVLAYQRA